MGIEWEWGWGGINKWRIGLIVVINKGRVFLFLLLIRIGMYS